MNDNSTLESLLQRVSLRFRARTALVLFDAKTLQDPERVISTQSLPPHFKSYLERTYDPYLQSGEEFSFESYDSRAFGLRDAWTSDSFLCDFSPFGYRYTIALPLSLHLPTGKHMALFWLGYCDLQPPLDREVEEAKQLTTELQASLASEIMLSELSGRVSQAEKIAREKNEIIAHLSHDIRSPLNNIKAILNLFKVAGFDTDGPKLLEAALKNCDTLAEVVEDLLDYSRYRMGKLNCNKKLLDLKVLAKSVFENFEVAARLKGLSLQFFAEPQEHIVEADANQLKRVCSNLISNAIKYTKSGAVNISLNSKGGFVYLKVLDTGVGMSSLELEQLFTPFVRFNAAQAEGVGLGLALSKVLVELNKGTLRAESISGQGSLFELQLPCAQNISELAVTHNKPNFLFAEAEQARRARVLIVDDDVGGVESLGRNLSMYGFEVLAVFSVREALAVLNFEKPELVLTDANMPGGGASRLLSFLVNQNNPMPVIVISGESENFAKFLAAGASRALLKPVCTETLVFEMQSLLRTQESNKLVA